MKTVLFASICFAVSVTTAADDRITEPFNGKDLSEWNLKGKPSSSYWKVGGAKLHPDDPAKFVVESGSELINDKGNADRGRGIDIYTEAQHGTARIEIEVMVPKGSNSGVYVQGEYEVQIYDSWGIEKPRPSDIGAIYGAAPPRVNAAKRPGEWQKLVIDFEAPRFGSDGDVIRKARFVRVSLNGKSIHENVEMNGPTPGGLTGKEHTQGPILLQGDHGTVSYRNLKITRMVFQTLQAK
jgi:hypothetical protein